MVIPSILLGVVTYWSADLLWVCRYAREAAGASGLIKQVSGSMYVLVITIVVSSARIQEIVGRLQRFTNLDRAEVQSVDLNVLLADVSTLVAFLVTLPCPTA